jgi:Ca2+-binding RTX toxin-like protein
VQRILVFSFAVAAYVLAIAPAASAARLIGTPGDDVLAGTDGRDLVFGRAGDDAIAGNGGSDLLFGQRGSDSVSGDGERDLAWGGQGSDTLEGGEGGDLLHAGRGPDVLEGGNGRDILRAAEDDGIPDVLDCGPGRDRAVLRAGDVAVDCERVRTMQGRRPRLVIQRGTRGDDTLTGTEKRDFILARAGNDHGVGSGRR